MSNICVKILAILIVLHFKHTNLIKKRKCQAKLFLGWDILINYACVHIYNIHVEDSGIVPFVTTPLKGHFVVFSQ